ncbi:diacylglycerol kinase family lipid kinase [Paenibacillus sambharensis]|uniref:Diacylglycerol kinase family lipid kinase n=1 Tax=Paenibacillus sambharensis TaxID=1803190 RepID=A0A2W1LGQ4_9BACL|nr:YegS/Rv2252/BmrU family lipid kinase [Paenibacillus sambharensis]PZD97879.1 diacylglycerol kinase family lipid kinase [Paenibacillus sambharensis]
METAYGKAAVIYNGHAGQSALQERLGVTASVIAPGVGELTLLQTEGPGDAERLCRERAMEFDLLLTLGGDGTVHECINGLAALQSPPPFGILPSGTCNDFARSLGLPLNLEDAARLVLDTEPVPIDIGEANGRYFSNFFGVGLITAASENIDEGLKSQFGKLSYFLSSLQVLNSAESFAYRLVTDEEERSGEAVMILAFNGRSIGTNTLPLEEAGLQDGLLDIFVVREAGLALLFEVLSRRDPSAWKQEGGNIDYFQSAKVTLATQQPMKADMDGEIYMNTPAVLRTHCRQLRIFKPAAG